MLDESIVPRDIARDVAPAVTGAEREEVSSRHPLLSPPPVKLSPPPRTGDRAMPTEFPYMMTVGNIGDILDRIRDAGTPPKFTHEFLKSSLGFRGSGDRGIVKVLKQLGFLTNDSTPTNRYNDFRSKTTGGMALAEGLRDGWADIFLADQRAHEKSVAQLTDLFKSVSGAGDSVAQKMAQTFKALTSKADWTVQSAGTGQSETAPPDETAANSVWSEHPTRGDLNLHHDIHIHLPATSDVAVYTAIFRALRDELRD